jgi:hypothetical protein
MKDEFIKLRVSADQRAAWQACANLDGLSLSAWPRRSADESVALARALSSRPTTFGAGERQSTKPRLLQRRGERCSRSGRRAVAE